jgi:hypothetical protein
MIELPLDVFLMTIILTLAVGMMVGSRLEAARWRANADAIVRIESNGRLFKVSRR